MKEKRIEKGFSLNEFAAKLSIAPTHIRDIEMSRNYPPVKRLDDIASLLSLTEEEKAYMLDLAAVTRPKTIVSNLRPLL